MRHLIHRPRFIHRPRLTARNVIAGLAAVGVITAGLVYAAGTAASPTHVHLAGDTIGGPTCPALEARNPQHIGLVGKDVDDWRTSRVVVGPGSLQAYDEVDVSNSVEVSVSIDPTAVTKVVGFDVGWSGTWTNASGVGASFDVPAGQTGRLLMTEYYDETSFEVWRPACGAVSQDQLVTTGIADNFQYVSYDVSLQPADTSDTGDSNQ
jgi:hypothetical protein